MSNPFLGEIRIFAGNFPPLGWAFCDGTPMAISENDTLFQLIGTTYGGDGQETFNLPDLRGRVPLHQGQGPGISQSYTIGDMGGVESVTLTTNQIPNHSHALAASTDVGAESNPANNVLSQSPSLKMYRPGTPSGNALTAQAIQSAGGSQPHDNMQSYVGVNYIISLNGIFPTQ